jgi:hypothetical protein
MTRAQGRPIALAAAIVVVLGQAALPQASVAATAREDGITRGSASILEQQNLEVQRRQATYADQTVKLTRQALALTRATVALSIAQALLFLASTVVTIFATHAARRSARIAETALANDERPILLTSSISAENVGLSSTIPEDIARANHMITNYGRGVAWITESQLFISVLGKGGFFLSEPAQYISPPVLYLVPPGGDFQQPFDRTSSRMQSREWDGVAIGTHALFVAGIVKYRDDRRREYLYKFVYQYNHHEKIMVPYDIPYWEHT